MIESTSSGVGEDSRRPSSPMKLQQVFLVGDPARMRHFRWTIHRAQRIGTSGRRLVVDPRCQIYEPYFDLYQVLLSLWELSGSTDTVGSPWHFCKHCVPDQVVQRFGNYEIASIHN